MKRRKRGRKKEKEEEEGKKKGGWWWEEFRFPSPLPSFEQSFKPPKLGPFGRFTRLKGGLR